MDSTTSRLATPRPAPFATTAAPPGTIGEWLARPGTDSVRRAWEVLTTSDLPVLLTGPAGTGKSHLVSLYLAERRVRTVVLGSTGVSALQIGGQTVHSFFRLPPRVVGPGDLSQAERLPRYAAVDEIVVDETSMLRADLIDAMDLLLRRARKSPEPFGGVRVLFVGDPLQLPPVLKAREKRVLGQMGYPTAWFFDAHVLTRAGLRVAALDQIHRQRDPEFARLLSRVRAGQLSDTDRRVLARLVRSLSTHPDPPLILATTWEAANGENKVRLDALGGPEFTYRGEVEGQFPSEDMPVPRALRLKPGARLVFVKNDPLRRWANGSQGTVVQCGERAIVVRIDDRLGEHVVEPVTWENVRQRYDHRAGRTVTQIAGRYTQLPAVLGWAVTIHRSQGMTLDRVRIDLGRGAFNPGQTYVALSRVRSREGLELVRSVRASDVWADPAVTEFLERALAGERAHEAA